MVDFGGIGDGEEIDADENPIGAYLQYVEETATDSSKPAIKDDLRRFSKGLEGMDVEVTAVGRTNLRKYFSFLINETNLGDKTILRNEAHLRDFYNHLKSEGVIEEDPFADFGVKDEFNTVTGKSRKEQEGGERAHYLLSHEVEQLLDACDNTRNKLIIQFLYATGAREVEARRIEIDEHLDRENGIVNIPTAKKKGKDKWEPRPVPYSRNRRLKYLLSQWLDHGKRRAYGPADESPYLFVTQRSEQFSQGKMSNIVKARAHDAGIQELLYVDANGNKRWKVTAHTLRHSAGYAMAKNGATVKEIASTLGHSGLDTAEEYMKWAGEDVAEMVRDKMPQ